MTIDVGEPTQLGLEGMSTPISIGYERRKDLLVQALTVDGQRSEVERTDHRPDLPADDSWWLGFLNGLHSARPARGAPRVRIADLFCASGGLSLGARLAAESLGRVSAHELAVDTDVGALDVFRRNHGPAALLNKSVTDLVSYSVKSDNGVVSFGIEPRVLEPSLNPLIGNLDLLIAGPPCQGHSTFNNHSRHNDPRNRLYLAVPAVAVALGVPAVVIENVPGVRNAKEGVVASAMHLLMDAGYEITQGVLRADLLGWPQRRSRFFMVATKGWSPVALSDVAAAFARSARPISWALEELLDCSGDDFMHQLPSLSAENIRRIRYLHENELFELPNSERPDCHQNGTTYGSVYGRMRWDEPAQTITTGFLTPGRGRYVHPLRERTITPQEAARLQGFPDDYRFSLPSGSPSKALLTKWIGDAVPAPLGMAAVLAALANMPSV